MEITQRTFGALRRISCISLLVAASFAALALMPHLAGAASVTAWWPSDGAQVSDTQYFKALIPGLSLAKYQMYWQVGNGQLNKMNDSSVPWPHKEAGVDVSTWRWDPSGKYAITFIAKDQSGSEIGRKTVTIAVNASAQASVQQPASVPAVVALASPVQSTVQAVTQTLQNISGFYVSPNSSALNQANAWRSSRPADAAKMDILAQSPTATWLGGWNGNVQQDVSNLVNAASSQGKTAVMVAYNIPGRDCGSYSAGGTSASNYGSWISSIASGIGNKSAIVMLEPDSLAQLDCMSSSAQQERLQLISSAVSTLKKNSNTKVYLDASHSGWIDAGTMASRLRAANVGSADGFALNVSNFDATSNEIAYGSQISASLGGKHFVIDTSRNGNGSGDTWCNPSGRAIGTRPTTSTGNGLVDAYLWLKTPGESDGNCNGGPSAGQWWPDYALGLVQRAGY